MRLALALSYLVLTACASTGKLMPVPYEVADIPEQRRIEITYVNTFESSVCLLPEFWPNPAGKFGGEPETLFLIANAKRYPAKAYNPGYCVARKSGDCSTVVAPGAQLKVSMPYEEFELPESALLAPKSVELPLKVFKCRS